MIVCKDRTRFRPCPTTRAAISQGWRSMASAAGAEIVPLMKNKIGRSSGERLPPRAPNSGKARASANSGMAAMTAMPRRQNHHSDRQEDRLYPYDRVFPAAWPGRRSPVVRRAQEIEGGEHADRNRIAAHRPARRSKRRIAKPGPTTCVSTQSPRAALSRNDQGHSSTANALAPLADWLTSIEGPDPGARPAVSVSLHSNLSRG